MGSQVGLDGQGTYFLFCGGGSRVLPVRLDAQCDDGVFFDGWTAWHWEASGSDCDRMHGGGRGAFVCGTEHVGDPAEA